MKALNLNLLYVLVALDDCGSVSQAAVRLHRSQAAVSVALGKLRTFFADPLFVRSGAGMEPTPRARALIRSASVILARVGSELIAEFSFDPASSTQTVNVALSDVGEIVMLPGLLRELRQHMPKALIQSTSLPAGETARQLESGEVDLALGYFPDLRQRNFYQQSLYTDTFASLIRSDHPVRATKLSLDEYLQLEHAVVRAESRTEEVFESHLTRRKIRRRIVLATPHFASAPIVVAQSDLIVTIPQPLATYFASVAAGVRVVRLPFEPPRIAIKQYWHRKVQQDARNRWLRALVCRLFQKPSGRS